MSLVELRKITLADTNNIVRWRNQPFVRQNLFSQSILTNEQHIDYYHKYVETGEVVQFIITVKNDNERCNYSEIGTAFLKNIDYKNKKAEFGIFIGDKSALGKGYGKQTAELVIKYAFEVLGLNRVYLSVFADNLSAINSYLKIGFNKEGVLVEDYYRSDGYIDIIIMGITKNMWKDRYNYCNSDLN